MHNPDAGGETHSAEGVTSLIANAGHDVVYQSTDEPGWARALERRCDLVAIAGGDGTVRKALSALSETEAPRVAVLPLGTANNVAHAFGLADRTPEELVAGWADAEPRRFRLGRLHAGDMRDVFVESVGGGLFAEAIRSADRCEEPGQDKMELGLRLLRRLTEESPSRPWRLTLDGVERQSDVLAVEAMLIGETGPRIPLAPAADPEDRRLDLVLVTDRDRGALAEYLEAQLDGRADPAPRFIIHRVLQAELVPLTDVPMRVDDELWQPGESRRRATVRVAPMSVDVLTPR